MSTEQGPTDAQAEGPWDSLLRQLHALRRAAGNPSYAEMTRRLIDQRMADGMDEYAARIARSSLHDGFRMGRSRLNIPLTRELVRMLGADPALVDQWVEECETRRSVPQPAVEGEPPVPAPAPPSPAQVGMLMVGCVVLNLVGREFVDFFGFPIYLDMVGTAIAAIALGPWRGAAVGLTTNLVGVVGSGWVSIPFGLVNIMGALVWGYGVRRWRMGTTLPRFFGLNVVAAVACSLVAVPILLLLFAGSLRDGHDAITDLVHQSVHPFEVAVAFSNLLTSLADKLITGFAALVAVSALPATFRHGYALIAATAPPVVQQKSGV